jgi:MraZ protein
MQYLYVGEFQYTLDAKNRLTIPAKWRFDGDNTNIYLAFPNPIGCITVYPPKMIDRLEGKVAAVSLGNVKGQKTLMKLFSKADTFSYDKQGRIHLNEKLMIHAQLSKESVLVGNFSMFHIWSPVAYKAYLASDKEIENELSQILSELGL